VGFGASNTTSTIIDYYGAASNGCREGLYIPDAGQPGTYQAEDSDSHSPADFDITHVSVALVRSATMSSLVLKELSVAQDTDPLGDKGDIHVQLLITNTALSGAGMIDGIDVGEWQMGAGDRITPNLEILRVHCFQNEDLEVVIYDDDPGSSGRGGADGNGADDIIHRFTWPNFCAAADGEHSSGKAGYATIKPKSARNHIE